jgi:hypothetical protein
VRRVEIDGQEYPVGTLGMGERFLGLIRDAHGDLATWVGDGAWFSHYASERERGRLLPTGQEWLVRCTIQEYLAASQTLTQLTDGDDRRCAIRNIDRAHRLARARRDLLCFKTGFQQYGSSPLHIERAYRNKYGIDPVLQRGSQAGWLVPRRVSSPGYRSNLVVWFFTPPSGAPTPPDQSPGADGEGPSLECRTLPRVSTAR